MKAIIHGKRYDTEVSEEIGSWNNGGSTTDFGYCSEKLYRTKNGAFFLCGSGGASTEYGVSSQGGKWLSAGSKIVPFSVSDAVAWCEKTKAVETLEKYFTDYIFDA